MIRSMTGFGKAEHTEHGACVTVEVSSVNGRFFDLRAKMPRNLNEFEPELRKIVQKYVSRGRVMVSVFVDKSGLRSESIEFDSELADKYISFASELSEKTGIENNLDARTILSLPEIITMSDNSTDSGDLWDDVKKALMPALETYRAMREKEGVAIGVDMSERLAAIDSLVNEISDMAPKAVEANTQRLRKKIESFVGDAYDENRYAMEVSIYAERVDITEECVRLKSHCGQYSDELKVKNASGRKLSFLLQEMNREANTIGSKIQDAEISQKSVRIKEELEKLREQAENLE